jgi:hypothetical protein
LIGALVSLAVASALAASAGQAPASPDDRSPATMASVDRVRAALEKPPSRLSLAKKTPDFTIDIREHEQPNRFMTPILDFTLVRGVPQSALFTSPVGSQPLFKVELMPFVMAAASAVNAARNAYAKHAARAEAQRAIAAYCAAQPDHGAGIQICETTGQ